MFLPAKCFLPKGVQSCLLMGPGPGARWTVRPGLRRVMMSVSGFPLRTRPHHCSHRTHLSPLTSWPRTGSWEMSCLSNVTSSPSTSIQVFDFPKTMCFSFFSTNFLRISSKRRCQGYTKKKCQKQRGLDLERMPFWSATSLEERM